MRPTVAAILILAAHALPARAYSTVYSVDEWDVEQLADAGIDVRHVPMKQPEETPYLAWADIVFDCSKIPADQTIHMTAQMVEDGEVAFATRVNREDAKDGKIVLRVNVAKKYVAQSSVSIIFWASTGEGGFEAHGYTLSMARVLGLARVDDVKTIDLAPKSDAPTSATPLPAR